MPNTITVKIDVRKLDKARFFEGKADVNGHRPLYADLVLLPRKEVGKYGDTHLVKQSVTKEERAAKLEMPILGSATERGAAPAQTEQRSFSGVTQVPRSNAPDVEEDVPF